MVEVDRHIGFRGKSEDALELAFGGGLDGAVDGDQGDVADILAPAGQVGFGHELRAHELHQGKAGEEARERDRQHTLAVRQRPREQPFVESGERPFSLVGISSEARTPLVLMWRFLSFYFYIFISCFKTLQLAHFFICQNPNLFTSFFF